MVDNLHGRAERSNPEAPKRRAAGAGLDREGACRAIIATAVMPSVIASFGNLPRATMPPRRRIGSRRLES
jgi:hypothetical protein